MTSGCATIPGTARFATRFPEFRAAGFYRTARSWRVSSLGLGTYLGAADERTDRAYAQAAATAVRGGINFLDTAINYRLQRSERALGRVLQELFREGFGRDEIVISTKAGFLLPGAMPEGLGDAEVAGRIHSMAPRFLNDQVERSRENLGLATIDVLYLHNPETQLDFVSRAEFEARIERAFAALEELASRNAIQYYGAATWGGFRLPPGARDALSLARMMQLARNVGGERHRFRFIQLPYNLAMPEAYTEPWQETEGGLRNLLETAANSGVAVVASATLLQARLARGLPGELAEALPGLATDAQRAIQFARSAPGVTVALAGMSDAAHVREDLGIAAIPPLSPDDYRALFQPAS